MKYDIALGSLRRGIPLAAHVKPLRPNARAWIGIYPLLDPRATDTAPVLRRHRIASVPEGELLCCVRVFEVDEASLEGDRWLCEEDLHPRSERVVVGVAALAAEIERCGVGEDALEYQGDIDYPI